MFELKFDESHIGKDNSPFMIDRISPSAIGSYETCPLAFYYKYICKIRLPEENLHLLFGSAVHKAIEDTYNGSTTPTSSFDSVFVEDKLDAKSRKRFAEFKLLGREMVKNYFETHPLLDAMYNLREGQSEMYFKDRLVNPVTGELTSIPVSGILDRYLNNGKIIEYKTSAGKWSSTEERFKIQSRIYNLWYYSKFNKLSDETLYFILLKKFKKTSRDSVHQIISYKPSVEDLAEMWEKIEMVIEKVECGVFPRPEKGHPPYCDCYKFEAYLGLQS